MNATISADIIYAVDLEKENDWTKMVLTYEEYMRLYERAMETDNLPLLEALDSIDVSVLERASWTGIDTMNIMWRKAEFETYIFIYR